MIRQRPAPEPRARKRGKAKGPAGRPVPDAPPALVCRTPDCQRAGAVQWAGYCWRCFQQQPSKPEDGT